MRDAIAVSSFFREVTTIFAWCTKHDSPDRAINKVVRPLRVPDFPGIVPETLYDPTDTCDVRRPTWSPRRRAPVHSHMVN